MIKNKVKELLSKSLKKKLYTFFKPIINYYYNKGNKVSCIICKSQYRVFRSYGIDVRPNALCVNCGSLERHRLIWSYIHNKTDLLKSGKKIKILHFAPEKFFYKLFDSCNHIDYFPCDIAPDIYNYKNGKTEVIKIDINHIEFNNNTFDFILCSHVLEHIEDDKQAMKELLRVMKPDGYGIFLVPLDYSREHTYEDFSIASPEERLKAFKQDNHVRIYGKDFKLRLENAGFKVNEESYAKTFTVEDIYKYGFEENEIIYHCSKT
ncbi:class I SAM-dependent methyltransferase [Yeosuana sp. MJ-SS3]|uniref:Class I SAM-dependent methyltransferase n=1 Tax=Gilvirhabdus luticola TaxID=3079858 RepID=A0ABU3U580_9FLAO|nr:class I SAM-dependent methyltransferase [Yeosuana sp. MJ-SS3]MDU8885479.1 class I SAM-dependent methyltransferase [Yeosuana sp. MJ-SS3]